jgi:hypothetical protein
VGALENAFIQFGDVLIAVLGSKGMLSGTGVLFEKHGQGVRPFLEVEVLHGGVQEESLRAPRRAAR